MKITRGVCRRLNDETASMGVCLILATLVATGQNVPAGHVTQSTATRHSVYGDFALCFVPDVPAGQGGV